MSESAETIKIIEGGGVTSPKGFRAAALAAGIKKKKGALDLSLLLADGPCHAAAVFTRNQVAAAPVILGRQSIQAGPNAIRGVLVNAGNANSCTGAQGMRDAQAMQRLMSEGLSEAITRTSERGSAATSGEGDPALHGSIEAGPIAAESILVMSTGVIGRPLPMPKLETGIKTLPSRLSEASSEGDRLARAMMTTDTRPKQRALRVDTEAGNFTIGGVVKGSGMIHPDMATMLGILCTDAHVEHGLLDSLLREAVEQSFNRISVDGDTSTNDAVAILAGGSSGVEVRADDPATVDAFRHALTELCQHLAKEIVRDGEGAGRFATVEVFGARNDAEAKAVAMTLCTSPLIKTALAGGDPNWGRVLAAAGRAPANVDPDRLCLDIGAGEAPVAWLRLCEGGACLPDPDGRRERAAAEIFGGEAVYLRLDLGVADADFESKPGHAIAWTCDLTADYVRTNADYRS